MRRGHPGTGGWRNDNPRHFKPRSGGIPHYRPYKIYPLLGPPTFPPPGPRPFRALPPYGAGTTDVRKRLENDDGNPYRFNRGSSKQHRHQFQHNNNRQYSPHTSRMRYKNMDSGFSSYKQHEYQSEQCHINSMGDIDERQPPMVPCKPFSQYPGSEWVQVSGNEHQDFDERNYNQKTDRNQNNSDLNKTIAPDYIGHRPPSSDHYGSNSIVATDHSNSFSRSVDDTVNIVRKRLMNRNDVQHQTNEFLNEISHTENKNAEEISTCSDNKNVTLEQPAKRRIQRHRQNIKSDCDKIKNKIVHQLFKMDKEKIHKLMDNPSSSTKFEYAISSLITESQNSLNRHLRSVAEESLCTSSTEFIHNDNNTIYEDTFMKQMQCILDPQDTVFLEDIKPLVMEELRKVLQLNDFDQRFEILDSFDNTRFDQINTENLQTEEKYFQHSNENISQNENPGIGHKSFMDDELSSETFQKSPILSPQRFVKPDNFECNEPTAFDNTKPLYERRPSRKSSEYSPARRKSTEKNHQHRNSIDNSLNKDGWETKNTAQRSDKWCLTRRSIDTQEEKLNAHETALASCNPSFDLNVDQISEEEDPFAELDKQYHVAVDPSFIADDDVATIHLPNDKNKLNDGQHEPNLLSEITIDSKKEHNNSPLKSLVNNDHHSSEIISRQEMPDDKSGVLVDVKCEQAIVTNISGNNIKSENLNTQVKSPLLLKSLKRTVDQKPLHRKEKRKKSESMQPDNNKQILNKNIIINLTDCTAKTSEKCDSTKSIFNLFFSKDENRKQEIKNTEKVDTEKEYSDKYVKRKQPSKKAKPNESDISKRNNSVLTTHPGTRDNVNIKVEPKTKLKSIDLFVDLPRQLNSHKAHKNTTTTPTTPSEIKTLGEESKMRKIVTTSKIKIIKRHVATQVVRKCHSREIQVNLRKNCISQHCQTEIKRFVTKANQTDLQQPEKIGIKASDTFERMKEIDLEIQVLLQEKFKLYNSLESKDCSNTIPSLGMTVLNVTKENEINEDSLSEDAIVADFTNIPVEELEQIAFETVEHEEITSPNSKRTRRHKALNERKSTESPTNVKRLNKKVKTPNISLIEQIITDNRPLEDIISLVDLEDEDVPVQTKKTKQNKTTICDDIVDLEDDDIPCKTRKKKQNKTIISDDIVGLENENIPIQTKKKKQNKNVILNDIYDTPLQAKKKITDKEPKKKVVKKTKKIKTTNNTVKHNVKPCSVILVREEVNKYFNQQCEEPDSPGEILINQETDIVEETIVNEFDMLDVSEDIVIGESCEVKLMGDKDERIEVPLSEEVILDNSQSSSDDVQGPNMASNDNQCKMYDYSADESLRRDSITVSGNGDAVLAIECIENNFIVACLDGNVYYFNEDGQLITTLRGSNLAVTCLTIVKEKYGTTVYSGSLDSRIRYYDLETGLEKGPECNVLSPIQTMDRAWDTIFVGTRTGFVLQFECKNNMLIPVSTVKFSEQSILAIRALKEGPRKVLLVAARSENVTIKDAQTGLLLRTLEGPKMTVYTLLYEDGKVYCGTSSHQIHVFEYNSGCHAGTHEGGKGAVCLRAVGGLLFAGCYDGCVYVYRDGEARPFAQLRGPGLMLLSLAVRGTKIFAGYKDRSLYIWKIPLAVLQEMIL